MKYILPFLFLILAAACGAETFGKYASVVPIKPPQNPANSSVSVTVNGTGAAALLYADNLTTRLANPIRADAYGAFQFNTVTGVYDITMTRADGTVTTWTKVVIGFASSAIPWDTPGTIGSTTPNTGAFTSLAATSVTDSGLTSGRVPYATTGGLLTDHTGFTFNGSTFIVPNITNSSLTSGRVPFAGTAGLMQDASTLTYAGGTGLVADQLTSSGLTSGRITTAGTAGKLQDFAGLAVVGTPSATAPSTGTNGQGTLSGAAYVGADAASSTWYTIGQYGNGGQVTVGLTGYVGQGTAATPAAAIKDDRVLIALRGYDGTGYTLTSAGISLGANGTWTNTDHASYIQFGTCPTGSTTNTTAGRIDPNQTLVWGGGFNGVGTFSAGTQRPHIQTASTSAANCNIAQTFWAANGNGPTGIFAKSRSGTVGTQGVITTGDTLGTLSWQGDDGTNFIAAAQIVGVSTGTIATGQVPGILRISTATSGGTMTTCGQYDSTQVLCLGGAFTSDATYFSGTTRPKLQISSTASAAASITNWANSTAGSFAFLAKSRSGTVGTHTVVTTGDNLGKLSFQGDDGTNFVEAGNIAMTCTGTIGSGQIPGSMAIQVANSSGTVATRFTITATAATFASGTPVTISDTTASTSTSTGALIVSGGIGAAGAVIAGSNVTGTTLVANSTPGVRSNAAVTAYNGGTSDVRFFRSGGGGSYPFDNAGNMVFEVGAAARDFVFAAGSSEGVVARITSTGDLVAGLAGGGLKIKEGSNARMGNATLVGGTVTVSNTSVTANTRIFLQHATTGGTVGTLTYTKSASTSFTINSSSATDTSTVDWMLVEPAP